MHASENIFPINSRELIYHEDLEWRVKSVNSQKFFIVSLHTHKYFPRLVLIFLWLIDIQKDDKC